MAQSNKKLLKIKRNPKDVSFAELRSILEYYGFVATNYSGGSHFTFEHPYADIILLDESKSIPYNRPTVKPPYVKKAIKWIERVIEHEKNKQSK